MNAKTLFLAAVVAVVAVPAWAVDVINEDDEEYVLELDDGKALKTVTIGPKQTLPSVCGDCVITLGDSSADAEEAKVVMIRDGRVDSK